MKFRWETRIRFIDVDATKRIHYTALMRYFEAAEIEFFRSLNVMRHERGLTFPRVHVECDYLAAIHFDDLITIEVSVGKIGRTSVKLIFHVLKDEAPVAHGNIVFVIVQRDTMKPVPLPDDVLTALTPHLLAQ